MPGDDFQSPQRLARGLRKTTKPGPVSADIAGAFRANPEAASAGFSVIRDELSKFGTPEQRQQIGVNRLGGQTGPKDTLDAMRRLSNGGHEALLRKQIVDSRTTDDLPPGAIRRINHFRFR